MIGNSIRPVNHYNRGMKPTITIVALSLILSCLWYPSQPVAYAQNQEYIDKVLPYYVKVKIFGKHEERDKNKKFTKTASGIIIGDNMVITTAHVALSERNTASIEAYDGSVYRAKILEIKPESEVALLKVLTPWSFNLPPVPLNKELRNEQSVIVIGTPKNQFGVIRAGTVRNNHYQGTFRFGRYGFKDPIIVDVLAGSGFSGGPVFDTQGGWIGMIVGHQIERTNDGKNRNTGQTYVLPAPRILKKLAN